MSKTFSITMSDELYEIITSRSQNNHRSLSGEVNFLVEVGLGAETEELRSIMQILHKAGGVIGPSSQRSGPVARS